MTSQSQSQSNREPLSIGRGSPVSSNVTYSRGSTRHRLGTDERGTLPAFRKPVLSTAIHNRTEYAGRCTQARRSSARVLCRSAGQRSEVFPGCEIFNRMTVLGRPVSYRIGRRGSYRLASCGPLTIGATTPNNAKSTWQF